LVFGVVINSNWGSLPTSTIYRGIFQADIDSISQAVSLHEYFNLRDTMLWEHEKMVQRDGAYNQQCGYMYILSKGRPKTAHLILDKPNRWHGKKGFGQATQRGRDGKLTPYERKTIPEYSARTIIWRYDSEEAIPLLMAFDHIRTWTNEQDLVLAPSVSANTVLAAKLLNRRYIGIVPDEQSRCMVEERLLKNRFTVKELEALAQQQVNARYPK